LECDDNVYCKGIETCSDDTQDCVAGAPVCIADDGYSCCAECGESDSDCEGVCTEGYEYTSSEGWDKNLSKVYSGHTAIDNENNIYLISVVNDDVDVQKFNSTGFNLTVNHGWDKPISFTNERDYLQDITIDSNNDVYIAARGKNDNYIKKFTSNGIEYTSDDGWDKSLDFKIKKMVLNIHLMMVGIRVWTLK